MDNLLVWWQNYQGWCLSIKVCSGVTVHIFIHVFIIILFEYNELVFRVFHEINAKVTIKKVLFLTALPKVNYPT